MKSAKRILMLARAKERIKKLETIIGKMIVDTPLWADTGMLSDEELKMVDDIADKYISEVDTGCGSKALSEGRLYHFNPGLVEEVGLSPLKEETKQKSGEESEECAKDASNTTTTK